MNKISVDGTDIYRKDTHTGQYTHFSSFEPFQRKTAWIKSLFDRASKICSTRKFFDNQIRIIISYMSWNGYPHSIRNSIINKLKRKYSATKLTISRQTHPADQNPPKIWTRLPYLGTQGTNVNKNRLLLMEHISLNLLNQNLTIASNPAKNYHFSNSLLLLKPLILLSSLTLPHNRLPVDDVTACLYIKRCD